jgi:hypothetical protein
MDYDNKMKLLLEHEVNYIYDKTGESKSLSLKRSIWINPNGYKKEVLLEISSSDNLLIDPHSYIFNHSIAQYKYK